LSARTPPLSGRAALLADLALYQAGWFAAVLGAAHGAAWTGPAAALLAIAAHLALVARDPARSLRLLAPALLLGVLVDGALLAAGATLFPQAQRLGPLPPAWMLALWPLFAMLLEGPLAWLAGRRGLQVLFGAVGGPLAYLGGEALGALALGEPRARALGLVALAWGAGFPLLMAAARGRRAAAA